MPEASAFWLHPLIFTHLTGASLSCASRTMLRLTILKQDCYHNEQTNSTGACTDSASRVNRKVLFLQPILWYWHD